MRDRVQANELTVTQFMLASPTAPPPGLAPPHLAFSAMSLLKKTKDLVKRSSVVVNQGRSFQSRYGHDHKVSFE